MTKNQTCDRCCKPTVGVIMSMFNTEMICDKCKAKEYLHPMYKQAQEAELAAVKAGNYNFPGIGLPKDLK